MLIYPNESDYAVERSIIKNETSGIFSSIQNIVFRVFDFLLGIPPQSPPLSSFHLKRKEKDASNKILKIPKQIEINHLGEWSPPIPPKNRTEIKSLQNCTKNLIYHIHLIRNKNRHQRIRKLYEKKLRDYVQEGLSLSVASNDAQMSAYFLRCGADPNGYYQKDSLLFFAVKMNAKNICQLLMDYGAETKNDTLVEKNPLYLAAMLGYQEICHLILKNSKNPLCERRDELIVTAAYFNHRECALSLLQKTPQIIKKHPNLLQFVEVPAKKKYRQRALKEHLFLQFTHYWALKGTISSYSGPLNAEGWHSMFAYSSVTNFWKRFAKKYRLNLSAEANAWIDQYFTIFSAKRIKNYIESHSKPPILLDIGYKEHAAYMWLNGPTVILFDGGSSIVEEFFGFHSCTFIGHYRADLLNEEIFYTLLSLKQMEYEERMEKLKLISSFLEMQPTQRFARSTANQEEIRNAQNSSVLPEKVQRTLELFQDEEQTVGNCSVHNLIHLLKHVLQTKDFQQKNASIQPQVDLASVLIPELKLFALEDFLAAIPLSSQDAVEQSMLAYVDFVDLEVEFLR